MTTKDLIEINTLAIELEDMDSYNEGGYGIDCTYTNSIFYTEDFYEDNKYEYPYE